MAIPVDSRSTTPTAPTSDPNAAASTPATPSTPAPRATEHPVGHVRRRQADAQAIAQRGNPSTGFSPGGSANIAAKNVLRTPAPTAVLADAPSGPAALGATLSPDKSSTTFGVWAPDAQKVFVSGDFNGWSQTQLRPDGKGNYFGDISGATAGQQYKYQVVGPDGSTLWRNDPRALEMTPFGAAGAHGENGNSVIHDPSSYQWHDQSFQPPAANKQIVYELHVGTFNAQGGQPGTWKSAINKLDDLKDLGINTIEMMPPAEFKGDKNWGYDPDEPFAPESAYGSPNDLKAFIDAAHQKGIAVTIDWVANHMSPDPADAQEDFDGQSFGKDGQYFYTDARNDTGFGPRPDFGRPEVRQYWEDSLKNWFSEYHFDGARADSTVNIRTDGKGNAIPDGYGLLQAVTNDAHAMGKEVTAEDLQDWNEITTPTAQGGEGFDSQWDPNQFFFPMRDVVTQPFDQNRDMSKVVSAITQKYNGQGTQRTLFMENHDLVGHPTDGQMRIPEMISPGNASDIFARKRSTLAAAVMLTSPGIPMEFQGQEFLENQTFTFDNTPNLDWSKEQTFSGIRDMYKDLNHLRLNSDGNTAGLEGNNVSIIQQNDAAKVVAYHRWDKGGPGDDTIVLANFSNQPFSAYDLGLPAGGKWHVRFNGDLNKYSPDFANTGAGQQTIDAQPQGMNDEPFKGTVAVGPYSVIVLSQNKDDPND